MFEKQKKQKKQFYSSGRWDRDSVPMNSLKRCYGVHRAKQRLRDATRVLVKLNYQVTFAIAGQCCPVLSCHTSLQIYSQLEADNTFWLAKTRQGLEEHEKLHVRTCRPIFDIYVLRIAACDAISVRNLNLASLAWLCREYCSLILSVCRFIQRHRHIFKHQTCKRSRSDTVYPTPRWREFVSLRLDLAGPPPHGLRGRANFGTDRDHDTCILST